MRSGRTSSKTRRSRSRGARATTGPTRTTGAAATACSSSTGASHKSWLDDYGITSPNDLLDAQKNITAAYALYQRSGGWGPWGG